MNEELLLHELVRWENYNEYEGHCLATWHDRMACFYLQLQPAEWAALQPGMRWNAPVLLQRFGGVRHCPEAQQQPLLEQLSGVNYRVQGEVLSQDGEQIVLGMPWGHLLVDLDERQPDALIGQWVRLEGVLQARWPDHTQH